MVELVIASRFNGPPGSANGGYTCGLVAEQVGGAGRGDTPVAAPARHADALRRHENCGTGRRSSPRRTARTSHLEVPEPVDFDDAERASKNYPGFEEHEYATCFVCGPSRDDGLGLFAGAVDGTSVFAAPWVVPDDVSRLLVWAALDCPGAIGVGWDGRGDWLLGRMAGEVHDVPEAGERCVVVAWPIGREGRKGYAGTALVPRRRAARSGSPDLDRAELTPQADRVEVVSEDLLDSLPQTPRGGSCSACR